MIPIAALVAAYIADTFGFYYIIHDHSSDLLHRPRHLPVRSPDIRVAPTDRVTITQVAFAKHVR